MKFLKLITMKTFRFKILSVLVSTILLVVIFSGCEDKSYITYTYKANVPKKYMSLEELRNSVSIENSRDLVSPGKIYFKANILFINELFEGIHIIDNNDPSNPVKMAFIKVPGSVDIAIKGSILYVDSYMDLLAIDISDLANIKITKRLENVFSYKYYGFNPDYPISEVDESKGVVVEWEIKEITEKIESMNYYGGGWLTEMDNNLAKDAGSPRFNSSSNGVAGSMARFNIYQNYLYIINNSDVEVFDITTYADPIKTNNKFNTGRTIETLFVDYDKESLFIGSTTGMIIYNLSNPSNPQYISTINHITSCDPVVVEGNFAYVTLRAGNSCGGFSNQFDIIDISSLAYPQLLTSYTLDGPFGLGIDNLNLFICDGNSGLKIYDVTDPYKAVLKKQFANIFAFDIILNRTDKTAMMIGNDGLYQYDYSDLNDLQLISKISVVK